MSRMIKIVSMVLVLAVLSGSAALAGCGCGGEKEKGNIIQGTLQFGGDLWNGLTNSIGSIFGQKTEVTKQAPRAESTEPEKEADETYRWMFDSTNW